MMSNGSSTCLHDNKHAGKRAPMFLSHTWFPRKCSVPAGGVDGSVIMCDCELRIVTAGDVETGWMKED